MATDKPKLQGYISHEAFERFTAWKGELDIRGDSEALNRLLGEFFGLSDTSDVFKGVDNPNLVKVVSDLVDSNLILFQEQLDTLTKQVTELGGIVKDIQSSSNSPSNLPVISDASAHNGSNDKSRLPSELPNVSPPALAVNGVSPSTSNKPQATPSNILSEESSNLIVISDAPSNLSSELPAIEVNHKKITDNLPVTLLGVERKPSVVSMPGDDDSDWLSRAVAYAIAQARGYSAKIESFAKGSDERRYLKLGFSVDFSRRLVGKHHHSRWLKDIRTMNVDENTKLNLIQIGARLGLFKSDGDVYELEARKKINLPDFETWSQTRDHHGIAWKYDPDTRLFAPILD